MDSPPITAVEIWIEGGELKLSLGEGGLRSHHIVSIPIEKCSVETSSFGQVLSRQKGWEVLLNILHARAQQRQRPVLSTKAEPTIYQIEKYLKTNTIKQGTKKPAKAEITLEDLGL